MRLYNTFRCSSCQHKFNADFVDIEKQVCDNCIEENLDKVGKKYPYYIKVPTVRGSATERVNNKADEDRLINEFPELFIKES